MDVLDELEKAAGKSPPRSARTLPPFADYQEESAWEAECARLAKTASVPADYQEKSAWEAERTRMKKRALETERADEMDKLLVPSESRREETDMPSVGERIWKTVSGGTKGSASAYTNNAGNALYGEAARQRQQTGGEISAWQDTIDAYQDVLNDPLASASERDTAYHVIGDLNRRIDAYRDAYESGGTNERAAENVWDAADKLSDSSAADIARAKQGGGKVTGFLVDAGVSGTQMAGDALMSPIPGASIIPMAARTMGSSSQKARRNGASFEDAMAYGGVSALTEVASEKMFDGLAGLYGEGAADKIVDNVIRRASKNPKVRKALNVAASSAGEGTEELVSGALDPALKTIYNGKRMGENYSELEASDLLYGALLGAALGGIGGTAENARGGRETYSLLQSEKDGGTIKSSSEAEDTNNVKSGYELDREAYSHILRDETSKSSIGGKTESGSEFAQRMDREGRIIRETDGARYGYRPVSVSEQSANAQAVVEELETLGVTSFVYDGTLQANDGKSTVYGGGVASTLNDGTVGIFNYIDDTLSAREIAAHEMAHSMINSSNPQALAFEDEVIANLNLGSEDASTYIATIVDWYFGDGFDISKPSHRKKLLNELCGYISGHLYDGTRDISSMFHDYDAVKNAWQSMIEAAKQKAAEKSQVSASRTDVLRQHSPQTQQSETPYSDELRKLMDEFGGFREP